MKIAKNHTICSCFHQTFVLAARFLRREILSDSASGVIFMLCRTEPKERRNGQPPRLGKEKTSRFADFGPAERTKGNELHHQKSYLRIRFCQRRENGILRQCSFARIVISRQHPMPSGRRLCVAKIDLFRGSRGFSDGRL